MLRLKASLKSGDMDSTDQVMRISIYENDNFAVKATANLKFANFIPAVVSACFFNHNNHQAQHNQLSDNLCDMDG